MWLPGLRTTFAGDHKRATGMPMQMFVYGLHEESPLCGIGNLGGAIASDRQQYWRDPPKYIISTTASRSCLVALGFPQRR